MTKKTRVCLILMLLLFGLFLSGCQKKSSDDKITSQVEPTEGIPILMYHKVNDNFDSGGLGLRVPVENFLWQMGYLYKSGYQTISLQDLADHFDKGKKLPDKPVVITFDDGYEDNYINAYPILKRYHFTATIFIATDYVGGINAFDAGHQPVNKMLSWNEIKILDKNGFDIEAHTMSHPHLTKVPFTQVIDELSGSKEVLENALGKKINFMAYPAGDNDPLIQDAARNAGYLGAVVTDPQGKINANSNRLALERVRIMGHYDNQTFVNVLYNPELGYKMYLHKIFQAKQNKPNNQKKPYKQNKHKK